MSKKLATIDTQTPVDWCLESLVAQEPDIPVLKAMYRELEFFSFLKELGPTESTEDKDYKSLLTRGRSGCVRCGNSSRMRRSRLRWRPASASPIRRSGARRPV